MKSEWVRSRAGRNPERGAPSRLGSYKVQQRQLMHRGRAYLFVSYQGQPADSARAQPASPSTWFLMNAGRRWEVMPEVLGQDEAELDRSLLEWLTRTIL